MTGKSHVHQGLGILKLIIFGICLCTMSLQGMAQDDILESSSEPPQFKAENPGFNAIDLRQNRFMYNDSFKYSNKKFFDHMSLGVVWHYERMDERIPQGYDAALNYGFFIQKELGDSSRKAHALRLLCNKGSYLRSVRPIRMDKFQLELLYSFSWTQYFGAYNPYRKWNAVTNIGVGAFHRKQVDEVKIGPMFIVGAGARVQLSPQVSLGVDPYVSFIKDSIDYSGGMRHRKYNVLYGADVSLAYTFHQKAFHQNWRREYQGKTFVDFGLGIQFEPYAESQLQSKALPFFATSGPQLRLGIGHWISPWAALRATANLSSSNWNSEHIDANLLTNHQAYDIRLKNVLANGRLDLLFNLTGRTDNLFDVNAIVGWECGWMIKTAYNPVNLLKTYYDGPSGGLRLRYKCDKSTALYVEPRLTWANYSVPYAVPYDQYEKRCRDYLLSVAVGLEFGDSLAFKHVRKQLSEFHPNYSLSLQGGPDYMFVTKEYAGDFYMDYSLGVSGEVQLTPYSGGRVMVEYSQLSNRDVYAYQQRMLEDENILLSDTALCTGKYGFVNFLADYVFDLGRLLQRYNDSSRWDAAFAVGLVYSRRVRVKTIVSKEEMLWEFRGDNPIATVPVIDHSRVAEHSVGFQLGIPVSYRLNSHWSLFFEPRARFFPRDYVKRMHFRGRTKILGAQLGMKYTF